MNKAYCKAKKANSEVRNYLRQNGIPQWMLADWLNISPDTLTRKLRHELPDEEQQKIIALINGHTGVTHDGAEG